MALEYHVLDVFTAAAFEGNPLAVVLGAEGLSTAQLQLIAREFNLSETAFPLEPDDAERARGVDYRLRIFTVSGELPFAGHPSVGAAWLMARLGRVKSGRVVQVCAVGDLPLDVPSQGGPVELSGGAPTWSEPIDPGPALAAVGLTADDLAGPGQRPRVCGTGLGYLILPVSHEALDRCRPDIDRLRDAGLPGVLVAAWDPAISTARARMFAGDLAAPEDPATGSAALAYGVWLVAGRMLPAGGSYTVLQGVEMGRPSTLRCRVETEGGRPARTFVEGDVVAIARGEVEVPADR
jgi:trans-2,3-dihydro-3-hydroxyanthranilate isomerase